MRDRDLGGGTSTGAEGTGEDRSEPNAKAAAETRTSERNPTTPALATTTPIEDSNSHDSGEQRLAELISRAPAEASLTSGDRVGRYVVGRKLGTGGMGVVYQAWDPALSRQVALKLIRPEAAAGAGAAERRARLVREAQAMAKLTHPNVISVYDVGEVSDGVFVAMELVEGESLDAWCQERRHSWQEILAVFEQAGRGLEAAHRAGLVHRDFKPDNVLVDASGRARVLDFGLARPATDTATPAEALAATQPDSGELAADSGEALTRTGAILGTPLYMAPEQHMGRPVDARTDQFGFSVALWQALLGKHPFAGGGLTDLATRVLAGRLHPVPGGAKVPAWLIEAVKRGLAPAPADRFESMTAMLEALEAGQRPGRRRWVIASASAVAVALVAAFLIARWTVASGPRAADAPRFGAGRQRQATFSGNVWLFEISPDGRRLAYGADRGIAIQDLASGKKSLIDSPSDRIHELLWSPDGDRLLSCGSSIALHSVRDGRVLRHIQNPCNYAAWSPDGTAILAGRAATPGILTRYAATAGSPVEVPISLPLTWVHGIDWSTQSNLVLLLVNESEQHDALLTMQPDGSQARKIFEFEGTGSAMNPRWSPDGSQIYYHRKTPEGPEIAALDWDGTRARPVDRPLVHGLTIGPHFSLSADGKRLAYNLVEERENLFVVGIGPDSTRRALTSGTHRKGPVAVSPDGRLVGFGMGTEADKDLFVVPVAGGAPRKVAPIGGTITALAWSPDGSEIAALVVSDRHEPRLLRVDVTSGTSRQVTVASPSGENDSLAWAPGRFIIYGLPGNRNFSVLDPRSNEQRVLLPDDSLGWAFWPSVSPDGAQVAFYWNRIDRGASLWERSLDGRTMSPLLFAPLHPVRWSTDGKWIYATPGPSETRAVFAASADGSSARRVVAESPPNTTSASVDVAPDGRWLVTVDRSSQSDVWVDGLAAGEPIADASSFEIGTSSQNPDQVPAKWTNLDFEQGAPGEPPTGWESWALDVGPQETATISDDRPHHGRRCAMIVATGSARLQQQFDAKSLRDGRIRVGFAGRDEDGVTVRLVVLSNTDLGPYSWRIKTEPISSSRWQRRELIADIAPDTTTITLRFEIEGKGRAWVDDIRIEEIPVPPAPPITPPAEPGP